MNGCLIIVERELLALLRSGRTLIILLAVSIAFSVIVFLKWPSSGIVDLDGAKGREVFAWLTYAMLAAAILIVPVFPSTSLVTEVRRRTLELLLNSRHFRERRSTLAKRWRCWDLSCCCCLRRFPL